ncbi:MAG: hypothetical protein AAB576_02140 [Elusimicrobiota bacterium]
MFPSLLVLIVATVACGAAATATPAPTTPPQPAAARPAAPAAAAPAAPEAQAQPRVEKAAAPALPMPEKKVSAPAPLEEYQDPKTTNFLPPARHLDTGRLPEKSGKSEKSDGLFYLLQFAALGAGIFLLRYSELPFLLGLVRKPY